MTLQERREFEGFCEQATDSQVLGIIEKESEFADVDAFRAECRHIAEREAQHRGLL